MCFMVKSFIAGKINKLCSQQLNCSGGFIFLLRENNKRQILHEIKFKRDLLSFLILGLLSGC